MTLITKYRPKDFDQVIGQDAAVRAMKRAIEGGTSRTFLLTGPSGVGKTTLARIAATKAGCERGDIHKIVGTVTTGIDDMRQILDLLNYRPSEGEASAFIIDEFQGLSKQAVGALLDATEEPPSWVHWFICTTEPTKIPVAIKTRSLQLHLKSVRSELITGLLKDVAKKSKLSNTYIGLCADEALGSPRQALVNLLAVQGCKSTEEASEALASAAESKEAIDLAKLLVGGRASFLEALALIKRMREGGVNPESVRITIRNYVSAVALNQTKMSGFLSNQLNVLEAFEDAFNPQDGLAPIIVRCGQLMLRRSQ